MFRRITPVLTVLFSVLLDTSVLPFIYHGAYLVPLSLIVVITISILLGRMRGVLYGLIAGLLLDISSGSVGLKLIAYIVIGFLAGFLLDPQAAEASGRAAEGTTRELLRRIVCALIFAALYEIGLLIYQYFSNAVFEWIFIRRLCVRVLLTGGLFALLLPLQRGIYIGKGTHRRTGRSKREVRRF